MEVLLLRQHSIEGKLRVLFTEGDDNGDGVLSFEEFNGIIYRWAVVKVVVFVVAVVVVSVVMIGVVVYGIVLEVGIVIMEVIVVVIEVAGVVGVVAVF